MSRIGLLPVTIPAGVQVQVQGNLVHVKGPKGELKREFAPQVSIILGTGQLQVTRSSDEAMARALHGTTRALIQNMVTGVSTGYSKVLEIEGVGYRAEMEGNNLVLYMGYSQPVKYEPPPGISFETDARTRQIKVSGIDRELVGQVAANIRNVRPPEPYHGKGIHYLGERVRRKAGKAGKARK